MAGRTTQAKNMSHGSENTQEKTLVRETLGNLSTMEEKRGDSVTGLWR